MILLVPLFSNDNDILARMYRVSKQIETRKFRLSKGISISKDLLFKRPDIYALYNNVMKYDRSYTHLVIDTYDGCANDSAFALEACGIGSKCLDYVVILDMSDCLDYVLHRLTKCSIANIRNMPNYDRVSSSIMNLQYGNLEHVTLGTLSRLDRNVEAYVRNLVVGVQQLEYSEDLTEREVLERVLVSFFVKVLEETARIKDFCMEYVKQHIPDKFIYRSKSFSASLATSSIPINESLILQQRDYCDYTVDLKSYRRFEYLGGAYES